MRWLVAILLSVLLGCSGAEELALDTPCAFVPHDEASALRFVQLSCHQQWPGEAEVKRADMAPGGARVFWDPVLHASLQAGGSEHPIGSAAVREIYTEDLKTLLGWAIAIKQTAGGTGDDWLWVEHFAAVGTTVARPGASGCVGCHAAGTDFVQSHPDG
jgi:hypothetical protein